MYFRRNGSSETDWRKSIHYVERDNCSNWEIFKYRKTHYGIVAGKRIYPASEWKTLWEMGSADHNRVEGRV